MRGRINNVENKTFRLEYLPFDSEVFGFGCGRLYLKDGSLSDSSFRKGLEEARRLGFGHIVAKIPSEEVGQCNMLESLGFRFKICSLELEKVDVSGNLWCKKVLPYNSKHSSQIIDITREGFSQNTRFHYEEAFKEEKVVKLYHKWISNLTKDRLVKVFVYVSGKTVAGYITVKAAKDNPMKGNIGLFAVRRDERQKGIGRALLNGMQAAVAGSINSLSVMTESINYPALKVYVACGFDISRSWSVFHLLLRAEKGK